jgi:RNA polymerase sigma factor (sigma-70 family)
MEAHLTPEQLERLLDHADWLRALARRMVNDSASADDLVQETWVAALKSPPDVEQPVRPWLAGVLRNLVALQRRTDGRRAQRNAAAARSERLPSTAELIAQVDLQHNLARLVVGLPEPMRTTVLLRYHEGLSSAEIARIQGVPAGTVRWRLKRGVDQLRVEMDERYGARESWLASLAMFARVEPAECVATGTGMGVVSAAFIVLVAASLAAFALNPLACVERSGSSPVSLAGAPWTAEASAAANGVEPRVAAVDQLDTSARVAASSAHAPSTLRLVDARGAPIVGARVIAPLAKGLDGGLLDGTTDADGELALVTDAPALEVFVARPGNFVLRVQAALVDGTALVALADGASLAGRVVARTADAESGVGSHARPGLGGLVLELDSDRQLWGGRELPPEVVVRLGNGRRTHTETDGDGRFEFQGLAPDWSGVLWLPGGHRVVGTRSGAYSDESLYLTHPARDLVIEVESRGTVTGRVVGEDHVGLVGAELAAWTPQAASPLVTRSGADGTFRFALAPDAARELVLDVQVDPLGPPTTRRFGALPSDGRLGDLVVARSARGIEIDAAPMTRVVHVTAADDEGRPRSDLYVRIRTSGALFVDEAAPTDGGDMRRPAHEARPRSLHSGPSYALYVLGVDARLRLGGLAPGTPLEVTLEDAAGAVLARRSLPSASGGEITAVDFRVVDELRPLAVTVRDEAGELLVGAVVQLGAHGERGIFRRTGLDGRTVFAGLSAATKHVDVEVTKRGFVTSHRRGVELENIAGSPGEAARLELVLARGIDTTFVVLDETGRPVTDATVRVAVGTELVRAASHTGEGRYQLQDLPPAVVELHVQRGEQEYRTAVEPHVGNATLIVQLPAPFDPRSARTPGN